MKLTAAAMTAMGLSSSACVLMCGKVLKMTASQSKGWLVGVGWSTLLPGAMPRLRYVRTVTVDGQHAWQLRIISGGAVGDALYVAAQGTSYPLRILRPESH